MRRFVLIDKHINFLMKYYSNEPIVKKVLKKKKDNEFTLTIDEKCDFMEFLEDESVFTMINHEPTKETYILENIFDTIFAQTEPQAID